MNYLMAQTPKYPRSLLAEYGVDIPGDYDDDDGGSKKPVSAESDLFTDALLMAGLDQDRRPGTMGVDRLYSYQQPRFAPADPNANPYTNPYYAQERRERQEQNSVQNAKRIWDAYQKYQQIAGGTDTSPGVFNVAAPVGSSAYAPFAGEAAGSYFAVPAAAPATSANIGIGASSAAPTALTADGALAGYTASSVAPVSAAPAAAPTSTGGGFFGNLLGSGGAGTGTSGAAGAGMVALPLAMFIGGMMFAMDRRGKHQKKLAGIRRQKGLDTPEGRAKWDNALNEQYRSIYG